MPSLNVTHEPTPAAAGNDDLDPADSNLHLNAQFEYTPSLGSGDPAQEVTEADRAKQQRKDFELAMPDILLSIRQKNDLKDAFNCFDLNGTGSMEAAELDVAMRALGFELSPSDMKKLLALIDRNITGKLCFSDFLALVKIKLQECEDRKAIKKAFKDFDLDQTGTISVENLKIVAERLGEDLNDEEALEMITEADQDQDGEVSFEEFHKIITKINIYF